MSLKPILWTRGEWEHQKWDPFIISVWHVKENSLSPVITVSFDQHRYFAVGKQFWVHKKGSLVNKQVNLLSECECIKEILRYRVILCQFNMPLHFIQFQKNLIYGIICLETLCYSFRHELKNETFPECQCNNISLYCLAKSFDYYCEYKRGWHL